MRTIFPWTLLGALILSIILSIKPLSIYVIESYASLIIDNNVSVSSLNFIDTKLSLHVENKKNTLNIKIINFSPILIDASYDGDIHVFKKYQPLKGITKVDAKIFYDNNLIIDAKTKLYDSKTTFKLTYKEDDLKIVANIDNLDLDSFEAQNEDFNLFGKLNAKIILHNNDFKIDTNLSLPYLQETKITTIASYNQNYIKAKMNLKFQDKSIDLENILYDGDKLSFETRYLKTPLYLSLLDNRLTYETSNLNLKEVFSILKQKQSIKGFIDLNGKTNLRNLKSYINIDSKKLTKNHINIKALHVEAVADLNKTSFDLSLSLKNKPLELNGEVLYAKDLKLKVFSRNFDSKSSFYFSHNKFQLSSKHLDLQRFQEAFNLDEKILGDIDLEAKGSVENISFKVSSNEISIPSADSFLKPFLLKMSGEYSKNKIYFTPYIKNKNYILSRGKNIYNLKTKRLILKQQLILREKKGLIPVQIQAKVKLLKPYSAKAHLGRVNSISYIDIDLNKTYLFVQFKKIKLVILDNLIDKNQLFDKGQIDGDITYNLQTKSATSNIKITDALLNGIDLDKELTNLEDALGLNIVALGRNILGNYKDNLQETYIKELQLNTNFDHGIIALDDVALSTKKFRIAAFGDIQKDGTIDKLQASILDKHGCSVITQELIGTIQNPKPKSTSTAIMGVASAIPSALLKTGKKIIDFSAKTVDDVATYAVDKTSKNKKEIIFASNFVTKSGNVLKNTSDIVLPSECKVIYNGKVKHPIQKKKK